MSKLPCNGQCTSEQAHLLPFLSSTWAAGVTALLNFSTRRCRSGKRWAKMQSCSQMPMFEQCKLKNMTVADLIFQFCMPVYMQPLLPLVYDAKLVLQLDAIILHLHQPRSYHAAVTPYQEKVLPRHQRIMSMWALQRLRVCGFTRYSSEHASMQALQQHFGWVVGTHPMKFTHALTCSKDSSLVDKSVPVAPVAKDSAINLLTMVG